MKKVLFFSFLFTFFGANYCCAKNEITVNAVVPEQLTYKVEDNALTAETNLKNEARVLLTKEKRIIISCF